VTAQTPRDDYILTRDLEQGQAQLAHRVPVTAGAIKVIGTQRNRMSYETDGILIADETEIVAEAQRAKRNYGNIKFSAAEPPAGQHRGSHSH